MQSIQLTTHIGDDGILQVKMPSELTNKEVEVMIIFQALSLVSTQGKPSQEEDLNWEKFIEETAGSCADDPIIVDASGIDESLDDELEGVFNN